MPENDIRKLQDAKARSSGLVRRARAGEPQRVTAMGNAVVAVDAERFDAVLTWLSREPEES
jgi:prevent-host-death family protein